MSEDFKFWLLIAAIGAMAIVGSVYDTGPTYCEHETESRYGIACWDWWYGKDGD